MFKYWFDAVGDRFKTYVNQSEHDTSKPQLLFKNSGQRLGFQSSGAL